MQRENFKIGSERWKNFKICSKSQKNLLKWIKNFKNLAKTTKNLWNLYEISKEKSIMAQIDAKSSKFLSKSLEILKNGSKWQKIDKILLRLIQISSRLAQNCKKFAQIGKLIVFFKENQWVGNSDDVFEGRRQRKILQSVEFPTILNLPSFPQPAVNRKSLENRVLGLIRGVDPWTNQFSTQFPIEIASSTRIPLHSLSISITRPHPPAPQSRLFSISLN